ncbi:ATP-binding cassette domain-containing protein [Streptomyces sp. NBC_00199]|uniref:ATP-binding cassette domain-containing protein n=1 Tax=Streptomyces sp. NBC_00199 TaxID=2975678 RepID=UPI002B1DA911|nr:ATP-binding cassette domain-containing protein [Streptomyces sp. NBC_00199]
MSAARGGRRGLAVHAGRFLARRRWALVRLAGWSVLEAGQTFLLGYALARALDDGFLAGRADVGLWWLGAAGLGVLVGAYGTARVYGAVAALVEPLRDGLVARVVERGVREADRGALSGLTQQVEIARDAFAGLIMVSRSFVFTSVGALAGLSSLAPPLLLVVAPPLAAGVALFAVTLGPLARRQEAYLGADEALAKSLGAVCPGLRDVTAAGAEDRIAADTAALVDAELRAARALARWGVARVVCLALGGHLPLVLLLAGAPWLLAHGVTPGALVGALAYVTQSLLPALTGLIHGLGTSGSRLTVVLRRLTAREERTGVPPVEATDPAPPARTPHPGLMPAPRVGPPAAPPVGPEGEDSSRGRAGAAPAPGRTAPTTLPRTPTGPRTAHGRPVPIPPDHPANGPSPGPPAAALSLDALSFAYGPACAPVVDGLTLSLPAGAHLAVAGPSGVGKSTLTALVAGLLTPVGGAIRICGRPVPGAQAAARRVLIPQEAYVFGGTLGENLGHLRPDHVPEEEMLAAASAVGLAPLMDALGGPAARIDPAALSAGERQLIALTRAYLSSAPLALLDEATCHLDPEAEARAERAFAARPGGTLVVVAHRVSSVLRADRVLVMDGPRTTYGTHDEVLRRSPLYRDLVGGWTAATDAGTAADGGRASQPALPLRDADGVDAVAGAGLARDRRHVVAHGPVGQVQTPGDLRDGGALGGEGQHA